MQTGGERGAPAASVAIGRRGRDPLRPLLSECQTIQVHCSSSAIQFSRWQMIARHRSQAGLPSARDAIPDPHQEPARRRPAGSGVEGKGLIESSASSA